MIGAQLTNPFGGNMLGCGPSTYQHIYNFVTASTATTNAITTSSTNTSGPVYWLDNTIVSDPTKIVIRDGQRRKVELPDGTIIDVAADGSFTVRDADAKVTYRANRVREFNAFLNASDKLEEFIRFCGSHGARQSEAMAIPIQLFLQWLIVEAAKADQEPAPPDVPLLPDLRKVVAQPRCASCQRFIPRIARLRRVEVCSVRCFEKHSLLAA